jgi:hypothetical protein
MALFTTKWRKGDRVLAPWEPVFLYAGTVNAVREGKALIEFDDGDSGWVELAHVRPLSLQRGQRVMSRRRMGPHFFPGEVREVAGENVQVEFDDGKEEETTVASLRIPIPPLPHGAEPVKATSHRAFLERLQEGDRVWALWNNAALFAGTIGERNENEAQIHFDDGDEGWVKLEHLLPLDLIVGMPVMARRRATGEFHPGVISDTEGDRVQVRYQDGNEEWTTASALALPLTGPPSPAPAPGHAPAPPMPPVGWRPSTVLGVGGIIVTAVAAFFYWLGGH